MQKQETEYRYPHYVDLIETWAILLIALFVCLAVTIGIYSFVTEELESLLMCLLGAGGVLCIIWLPGLLVAAFRENIYQYLARLNPVYARPRSIFADGFKSLDRLRIGGTANIIAMVAMLLLSGLVVFMSFVGVVWDLSAFNIAIGSGAILSWAGALIIVLRFIADIVQAKHKTRRLL